MSPKTCSSSRNRFFSFRSLTKRLQVTIRMAVGATIMTTNAETRGAMLAGACGIGAARSQSVHSQTSDGTFTYLS